ncbi:hypothetical protein FHW67_001009 [Herbaspirillum sp. Sphag1AN]|uniref:DUF3304 domain-containing protein n=1 Tax=unclassified Herbaspirillum TaxID=2624150 RepID=UPI0016208AC4|nr:MULTISPECIES: DUF3304 domain-containing protein [unclassified Herbaspirillum]MBB3211761.1 hypothetical protein [Herbaspirillum sp. Sphag1AN]MBB3244971.1 hypothetical protein [Herbaspirillum sp. Sphag64]
MITKKILLILSFTTLTACNTTTPISDANDAKNPYVYTPEIYVSISCVAHEGAPYISGYSIEEPIPSGILGGKFAHGPGCGGQIAAGYAVPEKWHPGMKVRVRWKPNGRQWIEKTTNILRYEQADKIFVHIFADDQVRVVSSIYYPESKYHPILKSSTVPPPEEE